MRLLGIATVLLLLGCNPGDGGRCNPLEFADIPNQGNCQIGFSCVYPTGPSCGVAYCCTVDSTGRITDKNPNCQPDTTIIGQCTLDLSVAATDGGQSD